MGLDTAEVILWAEKTFDLHLPDNEVSLIYTVGEFCDYLSNKLTLKHGLKSVPSHETIFNQLTIMLIKNYGIKPEKISRDARFIQDLNLQ